MDWEDREHQMTGNVKYTKEFMSDMYDDLFTIADYLIKLYKPCILKPIPKCEQHKKENGAFVTMGCRGYNWKATCCSGCEHLREKGCTVECLGCKTFICSQHRHGYPELTKVLDMITSVARKYNFNEYYHSKSEVLKKHFATKG